MTNGLTPTSSSSAAWRNTVKDGSTGRSLRCAGMQAACSGLPRGSFSPWPYTRRDRPTKLARTLASAVLSRDWTANRVHDHDGCIVHVLRREAEAMILPNLPAFLDGKYRPQDNDERLALLGVCQFTNRTCAAARLYLRRLRHRPAPGGGSQRRSPLQGRPRGRAGRLRTRAGWDKAEHGRADALAPAGARLVAG